MLEYTSFPGPFILLKSCCLFVAVMLLMELITAEKLHYTVFFPYVSFNTHIYEIKKYRL